MVRLRCLHTAVLLSLSMLLPVLPSMGQSTARLSGSVVDATHAVLQGAKVVCRNIETGLTHEAATNAQGLFRFPELPIGPYRIEVSAPGFKTLARGPVELLTGHTVDLPVALELGEVTQRTEVIGEIPLVQTATSDVQTTIDSRSMRELPLNGRNPLELVALTPGADFTDTGTIVGQQDNTGVTVNGLRSNDNNFQLDGAGFNNAHFGSAPTLPNPDTLAEFTVQSSNFTARESRAGAVVQLSTRSGTNRFNASLFEFLRNERLDARNFFDAERGPFKRNQMGGTAGGPIVRNRTFFFGSYQATLKRGGLNPKLLTVPNAALRAGDFSALASRLIADPLTDQPFPGSIIPRSRFDPISVKLLELVPLPNRTDTTARLPRDEGQDDHQFLVKIDHRLSPANNLSVRYFYDRNDLMRDTGSVPGVYADNRFRNQILTVSDSHAFGAALTATGSLSYSRSKRLQTPISPIYNGDFTDKVPLGSKVAEPELRVNVTNYYNLSSGGPLTFDPKSVSARAQFAWSRGKHLVQFGADFDHSSEFAADTSTGAGNWTFAGSRTRVSTIPGSVGDAFAAYLLGLPSSFSQLGTDFQELAEYKIQPWIQDDWRIHRTLTLNLGLRWEPWLPPVDNAGPLPGLLPGVRSRVAPNAPVGLVFSGDVTPSVFAKDFNNIAPRAGFAWDPSGRGRTVLRGGYGIYYRSAPLNLQRHASNTAAFRSLDLDISEPPSFADPFANYPGGNPFPFTPPSRSELANYKFKLPVVTAALDPGALTSYTQSWNLTVERHVLRDLSVSLGYVGNHSIKILAGTHGNPAVYRTGATAGNTDSRRIYPGLGAVTYYSGWQWGNFHSMQFKVTKRTRKGLSVVSNYVWGKAIDCGTGGTAGGLTGRSRDPFNIGLDKAPADFDVAHRVNVALMYDVPRVVRGKNPLAAVANNWQLNTIITAQTGRPITVLSGANRSLSGVGVDNADLVGDPARPAGADPVLQWFNTQAFVVTTMGSAGNAGRNILRGPSRQVVNFSAFKNFPVTERARLQFRFEGFNFFNRANFGNPNATVNNINYGRILGAGDPRVLQFGLKLIL